MAVPIGYKFKPTDQDLVLYYLTRKIRGLPIPPNTVQSLDDQFLDPQSLDWTNVPYIHGDERYYFMKRKQMSTKPGNRGKRVKRHGGEMRGFWRVAQNDKKVLDHQKQVVGFVSLLNYFTYDDNSKSWKKSSKSPWIMHEYRLHSDTFQELVVCRIKKSRRVKKGEGVDIRQQASAVDEGNHDQQAEVVPTVDHEDNLAESANDLEHDLEFSTVNNEDNRETDGDDRAWKRMRIDDHNTSAATISDHQ